MGINELANEAQNKKQAFVALRNARCEYAEIKRAAEAYADAIAAWHKARFPSKRFRKPSAAYLIRAI